MANHLAGATSPYLLQHAGNPVDWWEWGADAFAEAKRRDTPILLSVGYAACHWCHVMAHESFEDEATAAYMNEHFVNIKVDREERPDVDAVYMAATTAMTGSGGWPMTVVLDHDGNPFFAGTYFPDMPRHGQPAFTQVLQALSEAWTQRRSEIGAVAENVRQHLTAISGADGTAGDWQVDVGAAVETLAGQFDPMAGGFGGAPKFPPSMVLEFLRRTALSASETDSSAPDSDVSGRASHMLARTVAAMAGGGLYDQIGGGFARYAVDRGWVVPHFEKMLYDNAQLIGLYARLGTELGDRVARESADWMIRELAPPRAASPRPSTPTARGSRGSSTSGPRPSSSRSSAPRTVPGPRRSSRSPRRGRSRRGHRRSSCAIGPTTPSGSSRSRLGSSPRVRSGSARRATTRSSRRGTGWRSVGWSMPGCCWGSRGTSMRRSRQRSCCGGCTFKARACSASAATAQQVRTRACSRTTAVLPAAS